MTEAQGGLQMERMLGRRPDHLQDLATERVMRPGSVLRWLWQAFLEGAAACGASYAAMPWLLDQYVNRRTEEED